MESVEDRRLIPRLGQGGVDATTRNAAKPPLMERTGRFVQHPIIGHLNKQFLMLRAIALALRARLRR